MNDDRREAETTAAQALADLVDTYGWDRVAANPATVRALLNDSLGTEAVTLRREVKLLAEAAAEGIPGMLDGSAGGPRSTAESRLIALGLHEEAARWAVQAWADARTGTRTAPLPVAPSGSDPASVENRDRGRTRRLTVFSVLTVVVAAALITAAVAFSGDGSQSASDTRRASRTTTSQKDAGTDRPPPSSTGTPPSGPLATSTQIDPGDIASHAGMLYISDNRFHRIWRVDSDGVITTVAGNGEAGYSGDGGPATSANLNSPNGIAVDTAGNLYISDTANHRIRRIDPKTGVITTVAGTGVAGFSGDGGLAASAQLGSPWGIAVGPDDDIYIADSFRRVRRVSFGLGGANARGAITTVAGTGPEAFPGMRQGTLFDSPRSPLDGVVTDAVGNLYVADANGNRVLQLDSAGKFRVVAGTGVAGFSGDGGLATVAQLAQPRGLAVDPGGNLYIADSQNNRVRRVDRAGTITTVAGTGEAGFSGDGGGATSALLDSPGDLDADAAGNLYVADLGERVRRIDAKGVITTVAGLGRVG